jgi:hypothetical protein
MSNFLLAYHGGGMAMTEAERAKTMQEWGAWFQQLGTAVVDGGNPVSGASQISSTGSVSEGAGSNPLTGYSILKADSMDAATKLARSCPVLKSGGNIEVYEIVPAM